MIDQTILLKFPPELALNIQAFQLLQELNPELLLKTGDENCISIYEKDFLFDDVDFIELNLPENLHLSYDQFEEFGELNEIYKLEKPENGIIRIYMGTSALITVFTALISATIIIWNRIQKIGRITEATGRFDLENKDNRSEIKILAPDVSFIAFEKAAKDYLTQHKFFKVAPTLCIEIVSAKEGLLQNLRKMENEWMTAGTDIGLVVCLHSQKYFLFEKDKTGYQTFDFTIPFSHSQLPGLIVDFDALWKEVRDEFVN
jgi:Uma2 family endonuclease